MVFYEYLEFIFMARMPSTALCESAMSSQPIVTTEELSCLLSPSPAAAVQTRLANLGMAIYLVKVLVAFTVWQAFSPEILPWRYLLLRGALEMACAAVFWATLQQRGQRTATCGALLVASTTLLLDLLSLLA